ncbi:hypothetical protein BC628DRAFT_1406341 [Trametes gibbosa]|nr:hypothetical protein BC628DRAFT_1406341 [Trametes gibbosa]
MPSTLASVELCLACSASLPPRKSGSKVFFTQCCSRPICPNCLYTNPRLVRYNPCLRCLAGVNAVNTTSSTAGSHIHAETVATARKNVDGSVRDEDIFVVDDEESDSDFEDESDNSHSESEHIQRKPASETIQEHSNPPHINGATAFHTLRSDSALSAVPRSSPEATAESPGTPPRYFIRPEDTLLGISLKLGIDGRLLCRLNSLSTSTLRTTPHLLHTRSFLVLPPSISLPPPLSPTEQAADEERRARLARERAETRFQSLTKETDRAVAKAYVALADHVDEEQGEVKGYEKETGLRKRRVRTGKDDADRAGLEARATDHYFDDEEWEARERAEGREATLPAFPYLTGGTSRSVVKDVVGEDKSWWRWKN